MPYQINTKFWYDLVQEGSPPCQWLRHHSPPPLSVQASPPTPSPSLLLPPGRWTTVTNTRFQNIKREEIHNKSTWASSPPSSAKWWVSNQPPLKEMWNGAKVKLSFKGTIQIHLRIFAVEKQFLGRLVLHLLAMLVARHVPVFGNSKWKMEEIWFPKVWELELDFRFLGNDEDCVTWLSGTASLLASTPSH